jgi:hypothetical protein
MQTFVVCPKRGERKVSIEVCLSVCQSKDDCQEIKEVPEADIKAALARVNKMPVARQTAVQIAGELIEPDSLDEPSRDAKEEAGKLIAKVFFIKDDIETKFWEMGEALHRIYTKQYYVDAGYASWRTFCNECLDIKDRTATYLKDIYDKFSEFPINHDERKGVGWAKMAILLPIVNAENVKYWLDKARDRKNTVQVLNGMVKFALGKISKEEADKIPQVISFRIYEEQLENINRALEIARKMTGSDSRSYQLEMICAEFRATYESDDGIGKAKLVSGLLSKIQSTLKIKFTGEVTDVETGEILVEAGEKKA